MTAVQMAVLEIMKLCVTELKTTNPAVGLREREGVREREYGGS